MRALFQAVWIFFFKLNLISWQALQKASYGNHMRATLGTLGFLVFFGAFASAIADDKFPYARGLEFSTAEELVGAETDVEITRGWRAERVDLSVYMPRPGQQGRFGSCLAWAVAYATQSYYHRAAQGITDPDNPTARSPYHLYNLYQSRYPSRKGCVDGGGNFPSVLKLLKQTGAVAFDAYGSEKQCLELPPARVSDVAVRIAGWTAIFKSGRKPNLEAVLDRLHQGHPVVIGMDVGPTFTRLNAGETYVGNSDAKKDLGGHAMTIVGYDDRRQALKVMNSWGASWADGGFGWISYSAAKREIVEAYVIKPSGAVPRPPPSPPDGEELPGLECGKVRIKTGTETVLQGFVKDRAGMARVEAEAGKRKARIDVAVRPWPICEALLTLDRPLAAPELPSISTSGNRDRFKVGDVLDIHVKSPDYPAYLYLTYLQRDGTVANLLPRNGAVRMQVPPNTVLVFGDGKEGRPTFRISPPAGAEMAMLIAARSPISELEELENGDALYRVTAAEAGKPGAGQTPPDRAFLSALRAGILSRPDGNQADREISAAVLPVIIED